MLSNKTLKPYYNNILGVQKKKRQVKNKKENNNECAAMNAQNINTIYNLRTMYTLEWVAKMHIKIVI